jgi:hypothetical protein
MNFIVTTRNLNIMKTRIVLLCALMLTTLSGCEELGIPDPQKEAERKQAEGEAIGSACRQSGRALEDCFERNPKASKAAVFAGWRNMNDYMRENNMSDAAPATMPEMPANDHAEATDAPADTGNGRDRRNAGH